MGTIAQAATKRTPKRKVRELEVMVVEARRDTPDTTTLFLFAGNESLDYEAGHFCTIDPNQFGELEHFIAYLEDEKGSKERARQRVAELDRRFREKYPGVPGDIPPPECGW